MKKYIIFSILFALLGLGSFAGVTYRNQLFPKTTIAPRTINPNLLFLNECAPSYDHGCYRLKIFELAKKEGVANALRIIKEAKGDFPDLYINCNYPIGYDLGIMAYKEAKSVIEALTLGTECRIGYIRGVLEGFHNNDRSLAFQETHKSVCAKNEQSEWRCYFRKGLLAVKKAGFMSEALVLCDELTKNPSLREACIVGVTQEAMFTINTNPNYKISYNKKQYGRDELINLCTAMTQDYKAPCFFASVRKVLSASPEERRQFLDSPLTVCDNYPEKQKITCYRAVGDTLNTIFPEEKEKSLSLCRKDISAQASEGCFEGVFNIFSDNPTLDAAQKNEFCALFPPTHVPNRYKPLCD